MEDSFDWGRTSQSAVWLWGQYRPKKRGIKSKERCKTTFLMVYLHSEKEEETRSLCFLLFQLLCLPPSFSPWPSISRTSDRSTLLFFCYVILNRPWYATKSKRVNNFHHLLHLLTDISVVLSIWSYYLMGNRWGDSGNSVRLYFFGLHNHCRWWLQPWN